MENSKQKMAETKIAVSFILHWEYSISALKQTYLSIHPSIHPFIHF